MADGDKKHPLKIMPFHLSPTRAEKHVSDLLKAIGCVRPKKGWHTSSYELNRLDGKIPVVWKDMVGEARRTGRVDIIQRFTDLEDPYFGSNFGMATNTSNISIRTSFLGHKKTFRGPARNYPVEQELVNDILVYRKMCCDFSKHSDGFEETFRFFRAYLFSCISLIDAFINRYVHVATFNGNTDPSLDLLSKPSRLDIRLTLWLQVFGSKGDVDLKKGLKWDHFLVLKKARNLHVHAIEPYFGYRVADMVHPLNACREGIGKLIVFLQREADHKHTSLFQKLTSAPLVRFSKK